MTGVRRFSHFFYRERVMFNILPIAAGIAVFYLTPGQRPGGGAMAAGLIILWAGFLYRFWVSAYNWANVNSPQPEARQGIITAGPYARSRNPIYLSAIVLVTGFSIIFDRWEVTLLMVVPTLMLHLWQIRYEERYLQNQYPEAFLEYKKKVPRLIPTPFKKADIRPRGKPNWKKAIKNDTGPLAGAISFILVTLVLLAFFGNGRKVLATAMGITIVMNVIIVGKVQRGKTRVDKIPSTAPPFILNNLLRKTLYPHRRVLEKMETTPPPGQRLTIMDFGCGPGFYTLPLAKALGEKGKVIAIDIRPKMLEIVKKRARREGLKNIEYVEYVEGVENCLHTVPRLPYANETIDIVLLFLVLGEMTEPGPTCAEIGRVLKPGGMIYILENKFDDHYLTIEEVALLFTPDHWDLKVEEQGKIQYLLQLSSKSGQQKK